MRAIAWTDGSANNKTHAKGGYGVVLRYLNDDGSFLKELSLHDGSYINTTSAQMEIMGVLSLLKLLNKRRDIEHIIVNCDNEYVVNTIGKGWLDNWVRRRDFARKKNQRLWRAVHSQLQRFMPNRFVIKWIRGHDRLLENEIADALAKQGSLRDTIKELSL